jgi:DNA-binding MarR family transcriptional regulator
MESIEKFIWPCKSRQSLRTGDVAELTHLDKKDVEKAIKKLSAEGKVFSPVRCFWQAK